MTVLVLFIVGAFVVGLALPERVALRWPVAGLALLTALALMTHRFA